MPSIVSQLASSLRALAPLPDPAVAALARVAELREFAPRAWLLSAGEEASWCFLITRGLVRELYVGESGEEHTRSFLCERQVTGSLLDLLSGAPSITFIQALERTETIAWRYRDLDGLSARFPEFHVAARRHAEALYVKKTRREHEMLALSAAERYARWLANAGDLDGRVSGAHLASYLGVTPEHLSRLRRALGRSSRRRGSAPPGSR